MRLECVKVDVISQFVLSVKSLLIVQVYVVSLGSGVPSEVIPIMCAV